MKPLLALRNVVLSFARGRHRFDHVLADVSLEIDHGELVSVLAQRAQGKTTLLRVAAGLDRPTCGQVLFKGDDLYALSDRHRSRLLTGAIAFAGPSGPDIDLPVLAHVALPLLPTHTRRDAYRQAHSILERIGVAECSEQQWHSLADSERAMVAIAQAIAREPELLLVDDITATLGIGATESIGRLLRSIAHERGMAILMSVSNADATTWFDRVASLSGGKLLAPSSDAKFDETASALP